MASKEKRPSSGVALEGRRRWNELLVNVLTTGMLSDPRVLGQTR